MTNYILLDSSNFVLLLFYYELVLITASIIRRQFERANLEAMDESAEWRMKYDAEFEKNRQLQDQLSKVLSTHQILIHQLYSSGTPSTILI